MFRIAKVIGATVFALSTLGSAAFAGTVTLSSQGGSVLGGGYQVVDTSQTGDVYAGGFYVNDGSSDFIAWCLDLANWLHLPTDYQTTATPFAATTGSLGAARVGNIESLFETAFSTLDPTNNVQSAGFQLALWELVYETGSVFSVTNGSFYTESPTTTGANNFANGILAGLGGPITQSYELTFFEAPKDGAGNQLSQNLVTATAIPLPAAIWLLGFGLMSLVGLRRRSHA